MVKKGLLLFSVPLLIVLLASMTLAAGTTTLNTPKIWGNYTTLTWNCTTNTIAADIKYNVSIYYNASGGDAGRLASKLATAWNASGTQTEFTASTSIEALADARTYNFSCFADNGTENSISTAVRNVTIDNTAPSISVTADVSTAHQRDPVGFNWTCTDATSGVQSTTASVSANTDAGCTLGGTTSWTTSTGSQLLQTDQTQCAGLYTVTVSACSDYASNAGTAASTTFNVYYPEGGSAYIPTSGETPTTLPVVGTVSRSTVVIAIVALAVIVAIVLVIWFNKK